jgi:hypothetical protein
MILSLFKKKDNDYIEKEMDNLLEKEDEEINEDNKLMKALTYLQKLLKI